jgi:PAS domain S-box-containing protein
MTTIRKMAQELEAVKAQMRAQTEQLMLANHALQTANTQLRQAHKALSRNERIIQSVNSIILTTDHQGCITFINDYGCTLLGYSKDEILGHDIVTVLFNDDEAMRASISALYASTIAERHSSQTALAQIVKRSKEKLYVSCTYRAIYDTMGNLAGVFVVGNDISAQKQTEEALRLERNLINAIFQASAGLIAVMDLTGRLKMINPALAKMIGVSSAEAQGRYLWDFFSPRDDHRAFKDALDELAAGRSPAELPCESYLVSASRAYRFVHWSPAVLFDGQARPELIVCTGIDITDRKDNEQMIQELNLSLKAQTEELTAANEELETFSYSVSHDLRSPLNSINAFCYLLQKGYSPTLDEKGKEFVEFIAKGVKRMNRMIEDMLFLSRMTRDEVHRRDLDLSGMAKEILRNLQNSQPERQVETVVVKGIRDYADERLLRLALENLLANAWKFSRTRPVAQLEFGMTFVKGRRAYYVKDNGVGFDMGQVKRLFHPFQRLHTEREFEGTGIGLATVERAIRRHGGKVWATGTEGEGASFYFSLGT